jgi:hypothetical protein
MKYAHELGGFFMRRRLIAALAIGATVAVLAEHPGLAQQDLAQQDLAQQDLAQQGQLPLPPGGFKPPPPPPIKPYQTVPVTPPPTLNDPSFTAFRNQLAEVAAHKDRAALGRLVVTQNFWVQDKNLADPRKSGIENLAKAIDLGAADDSGWQILAGFATEASAAESPQQPGVLCSPADPNLDTNALEALTKATQTDPGEWGYPNKNGVEVHAAAQPNSPVIEKLGMNLVRVLPDTAPPANPNDPFFLHVAAPSGKAGYVDAQTVSPLGGDQICYTKQSGVWKITGYLGGAAQ